MEQVQVESDLIAGSNDRTERTWHGNALSAALDELASDWRSAASPVRRFHERGDSLLLRCSDFLHRHGRKCAT
jgi:hypothetical protein